MRQQHQLISSLILFFLTIVSVAVLIFVEDESKGLGSSSPWIMRAYEDILFADKEEREIVRRLVESTDNDDDQNTSATRRTRKIGAPCQLDFTFDKANAKNSGRRPNSAEIEALLQQTRWFLSDQISLIWPNDFVNVQLSDLHVPMHVIKAGQPQYSLTVRFFVKVMVQATSHRSNQDLANLLKDLEFDNDYKNHYAKLATVDGATSTYDLFSTTKSVGFKPQAGRDHKSIFGNPDEVKGKYFPDGVVKPYKVKPHDNWPGYYKHGAGKPCPNHSCQGTDDRPTWKPVARDEHWPTRQFHHGG